MSRLLFDAQLLTAAPGTVVFGSHPTMLRDGPKIHLSVGQPERDIQVFHFLAERLITCAGYRVTASATAHANAFTSDWVEGSTPLWHALMPTDVPHPRGHAASVLRAVEPSALLRQLCTHTQPPTRRTAFAERALLLAFELEEL